MRVGRLALHTVAVAVDLLLVAVSWASGCEHDVGCTAPSACMKAVQLLVPKRGGLPGVFGLSTGGNSYDQNGLMLVGRKFLGRFRNQRCLATAARSKNAEESHEGDTEHGPMRTSLPGLLLGLPAPGGEHLGGPLHALGLVPTLSEDREDDEGAHEEQGHAQRSQEDPGDGRSRVVGA